MVSCYVLSFSCFCTCIALPRKHLCKLRHTHAPSSAFYTRCTKQKTTPTGMCDIKWNETKRNKMDEKRKKERISRCLLLEMVAVLGSWHCSKCHSASLYIRIYYSLPQMQCLTCHYITTNISLKPKACRVYHHSPHTHTRARLPHHSLPVRLRLLFWHFSLHDLMCLVRRMHIEVLVGKLIKFNRVRCCNSWATNNRVCLFNTYRNSCVWLLRWLSF